MVSLTPRQLYEKAIAQQTRDGQASVMMFGLTLGEIMERIDFYDRNITNDKEYLRGFSEGFKTGLDYSKELNRRYKEK